MRIRLLLALSLVFIILVSGGCAAIPGSASSGFDNKFNAIVKPYSFNFAGWELSTLFTEARQKITNPEPDTALNSQSVIQYFSYTIQMNSLKSDLQMLKAGKLEGDIAQNEVKLNEIETHITALKPIVEQTLARQISQTLADQGIYNPFNDSWFKLTFPPVNFKLEEPLYVLIVSTRDKIERIKDITIKQDITTSQMEELESSVDKLSVSSLVVQIGGLGATFPSFVINNSDLRSTIDTAAHEWVHQYLAFKPLGFRYVLDLLGISRNYQIETINETVASMVGQELGNLVYNRYYAQYQTGESDKVNSEATAGFDFNAAMREIRKTVDSYLAQGQVAQAETYMEDQRQFLATKGYYIRKLNQAYFAFYGTYADSPTSIDPIGDEIKLLRKHSLSIKDFIDTAAALTSSQDLSNFVSQFK